MTAQVAMVRNARRVCFMSLSFINRCVTWLATAMFEFHKPINYPAQRLLPAAICWASCHSDDNIQAILRNERAVVKAVEVVMPSSLGILRNVKPTHEPQDI